MSKNPSHFSRRQILRAIAAMPATAAFACGDGTSSGLPDAVASPTDSGVAGDASGSGSDSGTAADGETVADATSDAADAAVTVRCSRRR